MQTFLPFNDFLQSAVSLDRLRLGKQRVEVMQLLAGQFINHPASKMWRGYEPALENYGRYIVETWIDRGYKNSIQFKYTPDAPMPPWFGDEKVHSNHRAVLLHKDPHFYGKFGWKEKPTDVNYWPNLSS